MNTITKAHTITTTVIANMINDMNMVEWDVKITIGNAIAQFEDAEGYKADGFKSIKAWMKVNCDNGTFRVKADQLGHYLKVARFMKLECVDTTEWQKLNFTCCRLLCDAIKHCSALVEFVNMYADDLASLNQKAIQEFCRLLKKGIKPLDALYAVQNPATTIETTEDLNQTEGSDDTIGTAADMSDHIDIKANLQKILAMMKAKEYADAEASLEAMIKAL